MVDREEDRINKEQRDRLEEVVRLELAKTIKMKTELKILLASEGWRLYKELIEEQLKSLELVLREPAGSIDGAMKKEHSSGVVYGLRSALDIPEQELETAEDTLTLELERQKFTEAAEAEEESRFSDEDSEEEEIE